jgi:hypothetical protein
VVFQVATDWAGRPPIVRNWFNEKAKYNEMSGSKVMSANIFDFDPRKTLQKPPGRFSESLQ